MFDWQMLANPAQKSAILFCRRCDVLPVEIQHDPAWDERQYYQLAKRHITLKSNPISSKLFATLKEYFI
jgi:hypothetical protein